MDPPGPPPQAPLWGSHCCCHNVFTVLFAGASGFPLTVASARSSFLTVGRGRETENRSVCGVSLHAPSRPESSHGSLSSPSSSRSSWPPHLSTPPGSGCTRPCPPPAPSPGSVSLHHPRHPCPRSQTDPSSAFSPALPLCGKSVSYSVMYETLCNPMDSSPPGSSVHGILQATKHTGVGCHFLLQGIFLTVVI